MDETHPQWLTVAEAAKRLNRSPKAIWRRYHYEPGFGRRLGRHWLVSSTAVERERQGREVRA